MRAPPLTAVDPTGLLAPAATGAPARPRRSYRAWAWGLGLALAAPLAGRALLAHNLGRLEEQLSRRAGVPCTIASVEAGLVGNLRLRGVRLGEMLAAEAVEASTSWRGLLAGAMRIDEIRVEGPRLALSVDAAGDSDLARVIARLAAARSRPAPAAGAAASGGSASDGAARLAAPRRIVVSEGELTMTIAGVATLRASGVELVPRPGGVRAIAGRIELTAAAPGSAAAELQLELGSAAADLRLPRMAVERLLAVGGSGALRIAGDRAGQAGDRAGQAGDRAGQAAEAPAAPLAIAGLSLARLAPQAPLVARLTLDDRGVPRPLELRFAGRPTPSLQVQSEHLPLWPFAPLAPRWLDLGGAHFSGELTLSRGAAWGLSVTGHLEHAGVEHPVIASSPVELSAALDGTARLAAIAAPAAGTPGAPSPPSASGHAANLAGFELSATGRYRLGAAAGTATVLAHRGAALSATVELSLARAPCADLLASVPRGMRGPLEGLTLSGQLGGRLRISVDTSAPLGDGADVAAEPEGGCQVHAEPPGADVTSLLTPREHVFPDGSRAAIGPGVGAWVELRRLPAHVDGAFVAAEDARFFDHRGFDVAQIARSLEIDLREGRLARGGSTISQQLIKNAFLDGKRSMARKLNEAILTWRLEARLSKREILERYLNIIELGPSTHGLAAAAQHWFGKSPAQLTVRQAAFLAALTPEPTTMSRRIAAAGGLDRASAARVETVLRAMKRQGLLDQAGLELARHAELDFRAGALRPAAPAP